MTTKLIFDKNKSKKEYISKDKPILFIDKIVFKTKKKQWTVPLFSTTLRIKIAGVDNKKNSQKSTEETLSIGSYISPYSKHPIFKADRYLFFEDQDKFNSDNRCSEWIISLELNDLLFEDVEVLEIDLIIIDRKTAIKQIEDWRKKIADLYIALNSYVSDKPGWKHKNGQPTFIETFFIEYFKLTPQKLATNDLYYNNRLSLTFKPKGPWVIGAQGLIDVISKEGSYILMNVAVVANSFEWNLYSMQTRTIKKFNRTEFSKLLAVHEHN